MCVCVFVRAVFRKRPFSFINTFKGAFFNSVEELVSHQL